VRDQVVQKCGKFRRKKLEKFPLESHLNEVSPKKNIKHGNEKQ
jgi:hypothetical protein